MPTVLPDSFKCTFDSKVGTLRLEGPLTPDAASCLAKILEEVRHKSMVTVDAARASVLSGGAALWDELVRRHLRHCHLRYVPSQLALILQYDDKYQHKKTEFLEESEPASRPKR